jgi:outer membrane murein-binding lipoprotein Lpp
MGALELGPFSSAALVIPSLAFRKENRMHLPKSKLAFVAVVVSGSLTLGGCATKGYVNEQIATVNQRLDGIDSRLQAVEGTANNAMTTAQAASGQAQQNAQRFDQLNARVDTIDQRLSQQRTPRN